MILLCCASELGLPEDLSAIEVILYYYYYYYHSPLIFNQLLACLSEVAQRKLGSDIRYSPFIGLGLDESTDYSMEKHLVRIVRYVVRGACCTS